MWIFVPVDIPMGFKSLTGLCISGPTTYVQIHAVCHGCLTGSTGRRWMESSHGARGRDDRQFSSDNLPAELMMLIVLLGCMPWLWNRQL